MTVLGDGGVGKSALTLQLVQNHFVEGCDPTIEEYYRKQVAIDGETVLLDILDTAIEEEFTPMRDNYKIRAQGYLLVYSITSHSSFDEMASYRERVLNLMDVNKYPMVLVANKSDLPLEREVTTTEGSELANAWGIPFFETSAKARINIEECFFELVREIIRAPNPYHPRQDAQRGNLTGSSLKKCSIM